MTSTYDNVPLVYGTDTNIRLITRLPGPALYDGNETKVNCKFQVLPLTQDLTYTAISYMWSEEKTTVDIILDGARLAVRTNLYQLLLTLSKSKSSPDLLWADAICINQKDVHERNHQVGLMGKIYSQATNVLVWLGSENEDICKAIWHLRTTSMVHESKSHKTLRSALESLHQVLYESTLPLVVDPSLKRELLLSYFDESNNASRQLLALCTHLYWSRVWIVQEIFLAKVVCIQCANSRLYDLDDLYSRIEFIQNGLKQGESLDQDLEIV
jgi:hypothetical protein